MPELKDALDVLYELNELRDRAKELREQGRLALTNIEASAPELDAPNQTKSAGQKLRDQWIRSDNTVEAALLAKVLNHKDMGEADQEDDNSEAWERLKEKLKKLKLESLSPTLDYEAPEREDSEEDGSSHTMPVLVAARAMQALVTRSETVFSKATMFCYYRIVLELYSAAPPDWTIGAARAGAGGTTSAFITGECIRAIFAFEDTIKRTVTFCQQTRRLLGRYELLNDMFRVLGIESPSERATVAAGRTATANAAAKTPMDEWADRAIERMWFDWYISTNPRHGNMALHFGEKENQLLFHPLKQVDMKSVREYLDSLRKKLRLSVQAAKKQIAEAKDEIEQHQKNAHSEFFEYYLEDGLLRRRPKVKPIGAQAQHEYERRLREYDRALSAHRFAFSLIEKAEAEVRKAAGTIKKNPIGDILDEFKWQFEGIASDIHKVLEPAKRYIRTVLHREVAASGFGQGRFDAGELVFAASSFGAITDWKPSELLTRACGLLIDALPESGRLSTTRPFHSTRRGHRMLPIGCEMTRSLAQLLQKTDYETTPQLVRRMLNIFEDKLIRLDAPGQSKKMKRIAWNFEGSPDTNRPCVWVTAVSVSAIDRVVRMLNEQINSIVFKYFEVIKPEKPHSQLMLNDLVYPDYGLNKYYYSGQLSMAVRLEQMRAHVMRVTLPEMYRDEKGKKERVFSAVFYGPPGTGKTTLVEALALSSNVPLIRLSPSDLVVRGSAEIEGRARAVFEALSMLTQVVIILDEFESVVGQRGQLDMHKKEEIYEFLRTGMLPKLIKLHDSARKQSVVYCLATNYLSKIDPAAKRKGRFDLHLPVYDPDSLSRAGTLLYRLWRVAQRLVKDESNFSPVKDKLPLRFIEVVEMTSNTRASSLAEVYFRLPKWVEEHDLRRPVKNYEEEISFYWYILTGKKKGYERKKELLEEEKQKALEDQNKMSLDSSEIERDESLWLTKYEAQLVSPLNENKDISIQQVLSYLTGPVKTVEEEGADVPLQIVLSSLIWS